MPQHITYKKLSEWYAGTGKKGWQWFLGWGEMRYDSKRCISFWDDENFLKRATVMTTQCKHTENPGVRVSYSHSHLPGGQWLSVKCLLWKHEGLSWSRGGIPGAHWPSQPSLLGEFQISDSS